MSFNAGAIVGEIILTRKKWDESVRAVQRDVQTLGQKTKALGDEFVSTSKRLNQLGSRMALIGATILTPMVLLLKDASKHNAALAEQFRELNVAVAPFRDELITYLVPWMERLIRLARDLTERFQALPEPLKKMAIDGAVFAGVLFLIGGIGIKVAAAFEFLTGMTMKLLGTFLTFAAANPMFIAGMVIITVLGFVAKAMLQTEEGTRQLMTTINTLAQMFDLVATSIAAALLHIFDALLFIAEKAPLAFGPLGLALIPLKDQLHAIRTELDGLAAGSRVAVSDSFDKLIEAASGGGKAAEDLAKKLNMSYEALMKLLGGMTSGGGKAPGGGGTGIADQFLAGWKQGIAELVTEFSNFGQMASTMSKRFADSMTRGFSDGFFNVFKGNMADMHSVIENLGDSILRMLSDMLAKLLMYYAIIIPLAAMLGIPPQALGAGMSAISFQEGTDSVPATGLYRLHAGEKVQRTSEVGGDGQMKLEIYNMLTPAAVARAMSGKEGRGVVINIIDENSIRNGVVRREVTRR